MSDDELPIAYLEKSGAAVFFSSSEGGGSGKHTSSGTTGSSLQPNAEVRTVQEKLKVVPWGEDNCYPQNISRELDWCGIAKSALNWKSKALYGGGIIPGKVTGINPDTKEDIFEPLDRASYKEVYRFLNKSTMPLFWAEMLLDWSWYTNCFEEIIFSNDGKNITGIVHQESNDCRYGQMNNGIIDTVYLSKVWGMPQDQLVKFYPKKPGPGFTYASHIEKNLIKPLDAIDMYNPLESCKNIAEKQKTKRGLKSAILPVNYPSPNKTYYQLPYWDGARLAGWIEIASKVPSILKRLFNSNFNIKYHIQVPEQYFERLHGREKWNTMKGEERASERKKLRERMDNFLSGDENAWKSFISYFDVDPVTKKECGLVKIEPIKDAITIDKEILMSSAADIQILVASQVHPTLFGAGTLGTGTQRTGGSDLRESFLIQNASLGLERKLIVAPLCLVRDYNREVGGMKEWEEDIEFRFRDTVLTTLDTGAGSKKVLS